MIDLHCHLLPGVDDGAKSWEETLAMCRMAADDGVRVAFATPHYQETGMQVPRETVLSLVGELNERVAAENIALTVLPGNEIYAHPRMDSFIESKNACTYADAGQYVLFELPPHALPLDAVKEMVFRLTLKGITPILAHPERNAMFLSDSGALAALVAQGVACQITASVLISDGEAPARAVALGWFRDGLAHLLASDAHGAERRRPLLARAFEALKNEVPDDIYRAVRDDYPNAILEGRTMNFAAPDVPPDAERARGEGFSIRRWFRGVAS